MIIDTHSHCYWKNLAPRIDEIIENMQKNNIAKAVQIGCDIETSKKAIDLAKKYPNHFLATIGYHPTDAQNDNSFRDFFDKNLLENFDNFLEKIHNENADFWNQIFAKIPVFVEFEKMISGNPWKIVAIGECWFDFHYLNGTNGGKIPFDFANISSKAKQQMENQQFWWLAQWKFAGKYDFPLIIHTRDARDATTEFLKKFQINHLVMHCYAEDEKMARELLDFSDEIYFSFSGILTYKNAPEIQKTAQIVPLNRILIETDSPFLAPQIVRGSVNEPANTRFVLEKLAELRTEKIEILEEKIYENSKRFYGLGES